MTRYINLEYLLKLDGIEYIEGNGCNQSGYYFIKYVGGREVVSLIRERYITSYLCEKLKVHVIPKEGKWLAGAETPQGVSIGKDKVEAESLALSKINEEKG